MYDDIQSLSFSEAKKIEENNLKKLYCCVKNRVNIIKTTINENSRVIPWGGA